MFGVARRPAAAEAAAPAGEDVGAGSPSSSRWTSPSSSTASGTVASPHASAEKGDRVDVGEVEAAKAVATGAWGWAARVYRLGVLRCVVLFLPTFVTAAVVIVTGAVVKEAHGAAQGVVRSASKVTRDGISRTVWHVRTRLADALSPSPRKWQGGEGRDLSVRSRNGPRYESMDEASSGSVDKSVDVGISRQQAQARAQLRTQLQLQAQAQAHAQAPAQAQDYVLQALSLEDKAQAKVVAQAGESSMSSSSFVSFGVTKPRRGSHVNSPGESSDSYSDVVLPELSSGWQQRAIPARGETGYMRPARRVGGQMAGASTSERTGWGGGVSARGGGRGRRERRQIAAAGAGGGSSAEEAKRLRAWLRERGLGIFESAFRSLGVRAVEDLEDLVDIHGASLAGRDADNDLGRQFGMAPEEVEALERGVQESIGDADPLRRVATAIIATMHGDLVVLTDEGSTSEASEGPGPATRRHPRDFKPRSARELLVSWGLSHRAEAIMTGLGLADTADALRSVSTSRLDGLEEDGGDKVLLTPIEKRRFRRGIGVMNLPRMDPCPNVSLEAKLLCLRAYHFLEGMGCERKNKERASICTRRAADLGHPFAVGCCYHYGVGRERDFIKACEWYARAAADGHQGACDNLGYCHDFGEGVGRDPVAASRWYGRAASLGHAGAMFGLGVCYYEGSGVPRDLEQAASWFSRAGEQGHADAQYNLGACFDKGEGVPMDLAAAVAWFGRAADQGHAEAAYWLGTCFYFGEGVARDFRLAARWWLRAAEADVGVAPAQKCLGNAYFDGEGVERDHERAVYWYTRASEQGNAAAQYYLGDCYYHGNGVPARDPEQAAHWFGASAAQGNADGQFWLGICYAYGKGVPGDRDLAVSWWRQAALQGHEMARRRLDQVEAAAAAAASASRDTPGSGSESVSGASRFLSSPFVRGSGRSGGGSSTEDTADEAARRKPRQPSFD